MQPRDADTHVLAYADNYNDGRIKTFNVAADGTTVTNVKRGNMMVAMEPIIP